MNTTHDGGNEMTKEEADEIYARMGTMGSASDNRTAPTVAPVLNGVDSWRPRGTCQSCHERPATETWSEGGTLAVVHGLYQMWCKRCVLVRQLEHARAVAALIPQRERELAAIDSPAEDAVVPGSPNDSQGTPSRIGLSVPDRSPLLSAEVETLIQKWRMWAVNNRALADGNSKYPEFTSRCLQYAKLYDECAKELEVLLASLQERSRIGEGQTQEKG